MAKISVYLQRALIILIKGYRYLISPLLGNCCRFYPSCSEYAITAIKQYGVLRGMGMAIKRLLCCNPWHPGGHDPLK